MAGKKSHCQNGQKYSSISEFSNFVHFQMLSEGGFVLKCDLFPGHIWKCDFFLAGVSNKLISKVRSTPDSIY